MNEDLLMQALAQFSAEFETDRNAPAQINSIKEKIASAIFSEQSAESINHNFLFENLRQPVSDKLKDITASAFRELSEKQKEGGPGNSVRIFRRDVPFQSSQLKNSVPDWARGASVSETIGPVIDSHGRPVWFDIYRTENGVKVYLQGVNQPAIILSVKVPIVLTNNQTWSQFTIPGSSAWINASLFTPGAPNNEFMGLKVKNGTISFSQKVKINNDIINVLQGTVVTVELFLTQQIASGDAPENIGIDAKNATINLPEKISFTFNHSGATITAAGDARWNLYGQENAFTWKRTKLPFYLSQFHKVLIPYDIDTTEFEIKSASEKVPISGKANIRNVAWSFSCAYIDINNTLEANGAGALMMNLRTGLEATWPGLSDVNLKEEAWIRLRVPWILAEPGRISIQDNDAFGNRANQEFNLWKNKKEEWNKLNLRYANHFGFSYNCIQTGVESFVTLADCNGIIDKPVDVKGVPFELKSKATLFILNFSGHTNSAMLYDRNILEDNLPAPGSPNILQQKAIGLNNALLTVSPIKEFIFYGEFDEAYLFKKPVLIFSFGLLNYLPTLPDPYASNVSVARRRYSLENNEKFSLLQSTNNTNQILVAILQWEQDASPRVVFICGDITGQYPNSTVAPITLEEEAQPAPVAEEPKKPAYQATIQARDFSFSMKKNITLAANNLDLQKKRQQELLQSSLNLAGNEQMVMMSQTIEKDISIYEKYNKGSLFDLLDVSTKADLLGVSVGFVNERAIFEKSFDIEEIDENQNPFLIQGMDVAATSRFVRIFTVPQISWEPVLNVPPADLANNPPHPKDPPYGFLQFQNDGSPAIIGNTGKTPVTIAPIPAVRKLVENYASDSNYKAWSIFTLPNGMDALARYMQNNFYDQMNENTGAKIKLVKAAFANKTNAGWQIITRAGRNSGENNRVFEGKTYQHKNIYSVTGNTNESYSILGYTPTDIFNKEFGYAIKTKGVPLERYDFTGYGAQVFSAWLDENAEIAEVSQAIFDVWRGRVAKEIIQVRSIIYPWGIRVVRTITMHRASTGFEFRVDSGWRADSDGVYNFKTKDEPHADYTFHPGLVKGVFDVKNIVENDMAEFNSSWYKTKGVYVDDNSGKAVEIAEGSGINLGVKLVPVYFDADVFITDIEGTPIDDGAETGEEGVPIGKRVPSKKMVGYLQVAPRGVIIPPELFAEVLDIQNGLGGPVDCTLNINGTGQKMRATHVEVNHSLDESGNIVFVTAVKGLPVLPKDGSWSLAKHNKTSAEVVPVTESAIALIRQGVLADGKIIDQSHPKEITSIPELFKSPEDRDTQYAFLQNTDTQKILFRNPYFVKGEEILNSTMPDLGDAYTLMNSKGLFPNLSGLEKIDLPANNRAIKIIEQGYKMVDKLATDIPKMLEQKFQNTSLTFIDLPGKLKVYVEYAATGKDAGSSDAPGVLNVDINSEANNWVNKMNDITMVVDLAGIERIFLITGQFDTAKGEKPEFKEPKLIPGKELQPIIDILEVIELISIQPPYTELLKKGLQIAMSNSPNNWEYKFKADKEIPVIKFPPVTLDGPTTPLRLIASMKLGVYFNMGMQVPPAGLPAISAGAFIEFDGELQVMCVSLAAATIYAIGQVTLRISADTIGGPQFYLKMGFGVELMVGIPVIGNVSVYYGAGIEMSISTQEILVAAFILFRGRAELAGGLFTLQIQIEASGKVLRQNDRTNIIAQVTFRIDVSVAFVINVHATKKWQESRQIA